MDNIETITPQGEADVTASSGQSEEVNAQPSESTQPVDGGEVSEEGESAYPWESDEKFKGKTPDDIYQAYKEAEKGLGQLSQKAQIANLLEEKYGITPEQLKAKIEQQEYQQIQERYAGNPLAPVLDKVNQLEQIVLHQEQEKALQAEEKELDGFLRGNPDYQPVRDKLLELGLNEKYHDKSYEELAHEWFGQSRAQGQQDAYEKIETKKLTQTTKPTSAPKKKMTIEDMETMPIEDLREFYGVK